MTAFALTLYGVKDTRTRILEAIAAHIEQYGWAPTNRELGEAVGLSSPSTVHKHLLHLQRERKLVLGGGPRMIKLL